MQTSKPENMQLLTVTGYKGGISKSVTAVHLCTFLSDHGKVLLIDSDPNRTALSWAEHGKLPFDAVDERKAMKIAGNYDYAIIDTPARPKSDDLQELSEGCDLMILPTIPDVISLQPMMQTAADLEGANYRALVSIVPPLPNRDGQLMQAELKAAGIPVFDALIRKSIGISKAALTGVSARDLKGRDRNVWNDYEKLGKEVLEILK